MNEQDQQQQMDHSSTDSGKGFEKLGLRSELLRSLAEIGYKEMFPIQAAAIPPLMEGKDIIGQAHTGSGKTAAYALPILQHVNGARRYVQALVIVPTRELALQVTEEFNKLSRYLETRAFSIYGGQAITPQIERLAKKTPQIVVATPGRLIDHIERGTIDLQDVRIVVLDEADRMLDMGFIDDIDYIMRQLPTGSQTELFSATMPQEILRLSQKYMNKPQEVLIDSDELSVEEIEQKYAMVDERSKFPALAEYIRKNGISAGIIFCSTKIKTQRLAERLQTNGFKAAPIHGDLSQNQREHAMRNFRHGYIELLVATDVAARGIDVPAVSHVINYDVPQDPLTYFHRIGRTARAGKAGKAVTLVSGPEYPDFSRIAGMTEVEIKRVTDLLPEGYHPSEARESHPFRGSRGFRDRGFGAPGGSRDAPRHSTGRDFHGSRDKEPRGSGRGGFSFTENVSSNFSSGFRSRGSRPPPRGAASGYSGRSSSRNQGSANTVENRNERNFHSRSRNANERPRRQHYR